MFKPPPIGTRQLQEAEPSQGSGSSRDAERRTALDGASLEESKPPELSWAGQVVAGLVILADVLFNYRPLQGTATRFYAFACVMGVVGCMVGSACFVLAKLRPEKYNATLGEGSYGELTAGKALALIMLVLWSLAVGLLTFQGPYVAIQNGFFGTWLGFASAGTLRAPIRNQRRAAAAHGRAPRHPGRILRRCQAPSA